MSKDANRQRVALVHDWLVAQRGGENVLLELARMFPEAPIYTLVHVPGSVHPELEARTIRTSMIQRLPGAPRRFRPYLPLFPRAVEAWDLRDYDLIVSTSHCVAKGVLLRRPGQVHVSYVHTPMRYLWDQLPHYLPPGAPPFAQPLAERLVQPLRAWDVTSAQRPTRLVANSRFVAQRMARVWQRPAGAVVHPPVDVDYFAAGNAQCRRQGYVVVSALVPYKRIALAIALANARRLPLTVVGQGGEAPRLHAMAGTTVNFRPGLSRAALRSLYAQSEGLIFCGEEDFGIVPVEAMAAGCPVFALGVGGLRETVQTTGPAATGVLFKEPTLEAMLPAFDAFQERVRAGAWDPAVLLRHARQFDVAHFRSGMGACLADVAPLNVEAAAPPVRKRSHAS